MKHSRSDDHPTHPTQKKMKFTLPMDVVHASLGIPRLPEDGFILLRVHPMEFLNGDARSAIAWDPRRCALPVREKVRAILEDTARPGDLVESAVAAWQYFAGGPKKVRHWEDLNTSFQRMTRSELGFIEFGSDSVRLLCISDDEEDEDNVDHDGV
jgi:hypothetical protein